MRNLIVGLCLVVVAAAREEEWAAIIDAGSEGSRIYVYAWPKEWSGKRVFVEPRTQPTWFHAQRPGISHFGNNMTNQIDGYMNPLLQFFATILTEERVPADRWGEFRIFFKATAGMRALSQTVRDTIMQHVRQTLSQSAFLFDPAMALTISGEEEGVFSFLSANYAKGTLLALEPRNSWGVLDLGGASAQIAFRPQDQDILHGFYQLRLRGRNLRLYVHSGLGLGRKLARKQLHNSPCKAGHFAQCRTAQEALIRSFQGTQNHPLIGTSQFVAIGAFGEIVLTQLQLAQNASPAEIYQAAERHCATGNDCFNALWVWTLLSKFYGFSAHSRQIEFQTRTAETAIGGILFEANNYPWSLEDPCLTSQPTWMIFIVATSLCFLALVVVCAFFRPSPIESS